jgi:glutamate dehydrogenase (NAD(P)+)
MAWIVDEYAKFHGYSPGVVTGKPVELGGSYGREAATGRGLVYILETLLAQEGKKIAELTYAVQGFGNVGSWTARLIDEAGGKVVAVSDVGGAVYKAEGLDIGALCEHAAREGTVAGFPWGESIAADTLLYQDVDVLIPAALGGVIDRHNAGDVRARYILEGANHPTDPEADEVLDQRGIVVVPDILANAGGVTVSYMEWVQNIQQYRWEEERVNAELRHIMRRAWDEVRETARKHDTSLRVAAFALAIGRVARATELRGLG